MRKVVISLVILLFTLALQAQVFRPLALYTSEYVPVSEDSTKIKFTNSEPEGVTFLLSTNLKDNLLYINTNYESAYKIQFVDYWGHTRKVYKNKGSYLAIDVSEFEKAYFVMNITDARTNILLTSQVVNLKRKHL